MSKKRRRLLFSGGGLLLVGLGWLGVSGLQRYVERRHHERLPLIQAEAQAFAEAHSHEGCIDEALRRRQSCAWSSLCRAEARVFAEGCLGSSFGAALVCETSVPLESTQTERNAAAAAELCAARGLKFEVCKEVATGLVTFCDTLHQQLDDLGLTQEAKRAPINTVLAEHLRSLHGIIDASVSLETRKLGDSPDSPIATVSLTYCPLPGGTKPDALSGTAALVAKAVPGLELRDVEVIAVPQHGQAVCSNPYARTRQRVYGTERAHESAMLLKQLPGVLDASVVLSPDDPSLPVDDASVVLLACSGNDELAEETQQQLVEHLSLLGRDHVFVALNTSAPPLVCNTVLATPPATTESPGTATAPSP